MGHSQKCLTLMQKEKETSSVKLWLLATQLGSSPGFLLHTRIVAYTFHVNGSVQVQISECPKFGVEEGILLGNGQIFLVLNP